MERTAVSRRPIEGEFDHFVRRCADDPKTPELDTQVYTNAKQGMFLAVLPPGMTFSGFQPRGGDNKDGFRNSNGPSKHGLDQNFFWGKLQEGKAYQLNNEFMGGKMQEFLAQNPRFQEEIPAVPPPFRSQEIDPGPGQAGALLTAGAPNFFTGEIAIEKKGEGFLMTDAQKDQTFFEPVSMDAAKKLLGEIQFIPPPRVQKPGVFGRLPNGQLFYLDIPLTDYLLGKDDVAQGRRIFFGQAGKMGQLAITSAGPVGQKIGFVTAEGRWDIFFPQGLDKPPEIDFLPKEGESQRLQLFDLAQQEIQDQLKTLGVDSGRDSLKIPDFPSP